MSTPSSKRCLYEVLGVGRDASSDEIRAAYRRLALQLHPDKASASAFSPASATAAFQELVNAYEVLSDPKERSYYDSHRSQILFASPSDSSSPSRPFGVDLFSFFSSSAFSGFSDTGRGFYKVYAGVFDSVFKQELRFQSLIGLPSDSVPLAPLIGNLDSPYAQVTAFYSYWMGFCTVLDFYWADMYDAAAGENRRSRRAMEEENRKVRRKARREYNDTVRALAEFVKKRDRRVVEMATRRKEEEEKKKEEEREKRKEAERRRKESVRAYEEPEWARVQEAVVEEDTYFFQEDTCKGNSGVAGEEELLYCVACSKKFKSEKQWKNHEQSKKHRERVAELRDAFLDEDEADNASEVRVKDRAIRKGKEDLDKDGEPCIGDGKSEDEITCAGVDDDDAPEGSVHCVDVMKEGLDKDGEPCIGGGNLDETTCAGVHNDAPEGSVHGVDVMKELCKKVEEELQVEEVGNVAVDLKMGNGTDEEESEESILEAMVSGQRRNDVTAKPSDVISPEEVPCDHSDSEEDGSMTHDNRKKGRRSRAKKKGFKENANGVVSRRDTSLSNWGGDGPECQESGASEKVPSSQPVETKGRTGSDDYTSGKNRKTKKPQFGERGAGKGKKNKAASKPSNLCETCGEIFESRNKLFMHLGDTGHAMLKSR